VEHRPQTTLLHLQLCSLLPPPSFSSLNVAKRLCIQGLYWRYKNIVFSFLAFCLYPRHRRSPKKTALVCNSYVFRQSDADQLRRQSHQCSWTSSLELSADGPQTTGPVIQPFQAVTEDICIWSVRRQRSVNPPLTALQKSCHLSPNSVWLVTSRLDTNRHV